MTSDLGTTTDRNEADTPPRVVGGHFIFPRSLNRISNRQCATSKGGTTATMETTNYVMNNNCKPNKPNERSEMNNWLPRVALTATLRVTIFTKMIPCMQGCIKILSYGILASRAMHEYNLTRYYYLSIIHKITHICMLKHYCMKHN